MPSTKIPKKNREKNPIRKVITEAKNINRYCQYQIENPKYRSISIVQKQKNSIDCFDNDKETCSRLAFDQRPIFFDNPLP